MSSLALTWRSSKRMGEAAAGGVAALTPSDAVCAESCAGTGTAMQIAVSMRRLDLNDVKKLRLQCYPKGPFSHKGVGCTACKGGSPGARRCNRMGETGQQSSHARTRATLGEDVFPHRLIYVKKKKESPGSRIPGATRSSASYTFPRTTCRCSLQKQRLPHLRSNHPKPRK